MAHALDTLGDAAGSAIRRWCWPAVIEAGAISYAANAVTRPSTPLGPLRMRESALSGIRGGGQAEVIRDSTMKIRRWRDAKLGKLPSRARVKTCPRRR